tara:strand:- start:636 stop:1610 length:975 start_codon:yes stop_codon:yes gene_type:complete
MTILTISDGIIDNGKGGNIYVTFNHHILIYECSIKNENLFVNDKPFDMSKLKTVIFNFNEDLFAFDQRLIIFKQSHNIIKLFQQISRLIKTKYPNITIWQDPDKLFDLGDKVTMFNNIKDIKSDLFRVPKYKKISTINDLEDVDYFPIIMKYSNGSHTTDDTICKTKKEALEIYTLKFINKQNVFVVQYISSYIEKLNCNHCIRFMVTNNKLMEYYFRPSTKWNIHSNDQNNNLVKVCEDYYMTIYKNHQNDIHAYFNKVHNIFGNGFYAYDVIFNEKQGKYYICEIGLKIFDSTYCQKSHKVIKKFSFNHKNLIDYYKQKIII